MIRNTIKNISKIGSVVYGLEALIKKTDNLLILPFYHQVSNENPVHIKNLYEARTVKRFVEDLDFLLKHYKSISLKELIEINKSSGNLSEKSFHLTFDDGLASFYRVVAPILKERGVHATVFLNSDFIDNKDLFFRFKASILFEKLKDKELLKIKYSERKKLDILAVDHGINFDEYLINEQPYLTSKQIKNLIGEGFTFGAHSKNHPLYKELELGEQIKQTRESLEMIKTKFNLNYSVFSFPFTDDGVSLQLFNEIEQYTDLTFGCAGIKGDMARNHLQRIPMETTQAAEEIIKSEYAYCLMKQKAGKNIIERE